MGRNRNKVKLPTLPLCVKCHEFGQHIGNEDIITTLISKAPPYRQSRGEWEAAHPHFERYVARRCYFEALR